MEMKLISYPFIPIVYLFILLEYVFEKKRNKRNTAEFTYMRMCIKHFISIIANFI